jgi:hypothetical protein
MAAISHKPAASDAIALLARETIRSPPLQTQDANFK